MRPETIQPATQLDKLNRLIEKAIAARAAAADEALFATVAGQAFVNAAFDLFETDDLYDLVETIAAEMAPEPEDQFGWNYNAYLPHGLGRAA